MSQKSVITKNDLLLIANQTMQDHDNYISGMRVTDVEENNGVLIFKGHYFLDDQGLPTANTPAVFNMLKLLTQQFSNQFTLHNE